MATRLSWTSNRHTLTAAQKREAYAKFGMIDADESRGLDLEEIQNFLKDEGENPELASVIIYIWDANGDHQLSPEEFLDFYAEWDTGGIKAVYEMLFRVLDVNRDGELNFDEFQRYREVMKRDFSQDEIREIMWVMDTDGNGTVSLKEFLAAYGFR